MRLNNLASIVLATGSISLPAQSVNPQGIERVIEQTKIHASQIETPVYKSLFSRLYDKIQQFEFGVPQDNNQSLAYRTQMYGNLEGDINKLLLEYSQTGKFEIMDY